ncbi:unnamed protein product [Mytilus coruscus]|uniref:Uncharacterized protein n=1 Tax=Mytilus coruscus TaxID=42192 RepID=A0A6J8A1K5_MYTCO|nr:unnamed protein product [Mytilus coruscus]
MFSQSFAIKISFSFLVTSLFKISDAIFSVQCPVQSDWKHRADTTGSNVDVKDKTGETPLHLACRKGNEKIVKLFIDNGASIDAKTKKDKMRPFHEACRNGHRNVVDILLENNVKYDKQNEQGWTGLFFSCANGFNDIVKIILNRKPDVNRTAKDRITALHAASMNSHKDVVNTLLEKKANVNFADVLGVTPLYKS